MKIRLNNISEVVVEPRYKQLIVFIDSQVYNGILERGRRTSNVGIKKEKSQRNKIRTEHIVSSYVLRF